MDSILPINDDEEDDENLNEENVINSTELDDIIRFGKDEKKEEEKTDKRTWCQRTFGKMNPGSLRGSIFNLCILSLGTGLLAIPQKVGYMSVILAPIIISLAGLANYWSLKVLVEMSLKYDKNTYESLVKKLLGKKLSFFLGLIIALNQLGIIILYQVILYRLIGGVINEIGNYGYESVDDFDDNTFWDELWVKFLVCYGITILFLFPLCLLNNASQMRYASTFGVITLFLLMIIIIVECPFYIKHYVDNGNLNVNYYDIISGLKGDMKLLQSIVTVFFAFACHAAVFPVLQTLYNPIERRQKKVIRRTIYINTFSYLTIGAVGYLTQPLNTPDLIIERNKLFDSDWLMAIGEICFILTLLAKICANYNALRSSVLILFGQEPDNFSKKLNIIITVSILALSTLITSVFQSISEYMSLIGSFFIILIAFTFPGLIYIKGNEYPISNYRNILALIFIIFTLAIGLISGIFTIREIKKKKN